MVKFLTQIKEETSDSKSNLTNIIADPDKQELFIIREFNAPQELVFKAYTDPELQKEWVGPSKYSMIIKTFEPKSGGRWRFIHKDTDGNEFGFHGVFHEVVPPHRIIRTFEFEGLSDTGHVSLETAVFDNLPGNRTRVTSQAVYLSVLDRDGMIKADMEKGVNEGFDRLDKLLKRLLSN